MKTKYGKGGIFAALTAALLVTTALITSCNPLTEVVYVRDGYQPPEGMGYIRVELPGFSGERTVIPSAGAWISYDLSIQQYTALSGGSTQGSPLSKPGVTNLADPISLAAGYYTLTVTAYTASGTTGQAAEGTSSRFSIAPGNGTAVSVTLKPLPYTSTTNGTFEYSINLNGTVASTEMTITPLVSGASHSGGIAFTVTEGGPYSITLTPGSYRVFLEATLGTQKAAIIETVNIHQNLKSSVNFDFNGTYFVAYIDGINITYTPDDVKPTLTKTISPFPVSESTTVPLSLLMLAEETISIGNNSSFTSLEWFCGSNTGNTISGNSFTIKAGTAPFTDLVIYPVTVVGTNSNGAYSTSFKVSITN